MNGSNSPGGAAGAAAAPPAAFFGCVVFGMLTMAAGRVFFLAVYDGGGFAALTAPEKLAFLKTSLLFDAKAAATLYLPALLAGLLSLVPGAARAGRCLAAALGMLGTAAIGVLTVINHYYYEAYRQAINSFIFATFREDAGAVMSTVWTDYPLLRVVIVFLVFLAAGYYAIAGLSALFRRFFAAAFRRGKAAAALTAVLALLLTVFMLRGSLGTFPLRQDNLNVTSDPVVNTAAGNGPAYFYWAWRWHAKEGKIPATSGEDILRIYADLGLEAPDGNVAAPLIRKIPRNEFLERNPPDVVLAVMESMSTHMLLLDDPGNGPDLYGRLRGPAAEECLLLNFLSEGNGTSDTLMRLTAGVPDMDLSTSSRYAREYLLNAVRTFREHGYETVFLTSGRSSWRNLGAYLLAQGFDRVYDEGTVRNWFPEATGGAWGIDDEYLFGAARKILSEERAKPLLLILLTITNHPPYRVPDGAGPASLPLAPAVKSRFPYDNAETIFAAFRYANDQLGAFAGAVAADPKLAGRTIVAATGDHNLRGIGYAKNPEEIVLGHSVPFFIRLPEAYREGAVCDRTRLGSHKDIMTTLALRALSGGSLVTTGCDLLSPDGACRFPYAYNDDLALVPDGGGVRVCVLRNPETPFKTGLLADPAAPGLKASFGDAADEGGAACAAARSYDELVHRLYYYRAEDR